jgi:hypothetical protein
MKYLLLLLVSLLTATTATSQHRPIARTSILIDKNRPAVYLSYVRPVQFDTGDKSEDRFLVFKLTNNTRWKIWFNMSGGWDSMKKVGLDPISLYYAVDDPDNGKILSGKTYCHVCSNNPLASRRSILFPVAFDDVTKDARLRLEYTFEWESDSNLVYSSSVHYVQFYFDGLPETILSEIKK